MQLDSRINAAIHDIAQKLGIAVTLLDETGDVLTSSDPSIQGTHDEILNSLDFEDDRAIAPENGCTYFILENENYRPLRIRVAGISETTTHYGFLISTILDEILKTTLKKPGREEVFRRIMLERIDPLELQEAIRDYKINPDMDRCVIIVQTFDGDASRVYDGMMKLFPRQQGDIVVSLNRYVVALVKQVEDESDMDSVVQLVQAMDETISNELMVDACLGVGSIKHGLISAIPSRKRRRPSTWA